MKFVVNTKEYEACEQMLRSAAGRVNAVTEAHARTFGERAIVRLQTAIKGNEFGLPPKARGGTPLINTRRYMYSWRVAYRAGKLTFQAVGRNVHMSNAELADVLEFGAPGMPAKPHLRPWALWVDKELPKLGEAIFTELLGGLR